MGDFEDFKVVLDFISEVNHHFIFEIEGDVESYKTIYDSKKQNTENTFIDYHFDDVVGSLGYTIGLVDDNGIDNSVCIIFGFRGVVKGEVTET